MNNAASNLLILTLAGVTNASFTLPMKYARRWAWENIWMVWTLFALLILPSLVTYGTIPHLVQVYRSAPAGVVFEVFGFGMGWGVAQVLFGLAVDAIGIALAFSLVLGTAAAVGTLVPFLRLHPERLNTPAGHGVLVGVGLVVVGVLVCAIAGRQREKALRVAASLQKNVTLGLTLAVLSGLGASLLNFGLAFGTPLVGLARSLGASAFNASNAVWMPQMISGAVPNLLYCGWLLKKNRSAGRFCNGGIGHWLLAFLMAIFWFGSTLLYGLSTITLGTWGLILGWPLFMSLIVITAGLLGMLTGEWRNSGAAPMRIQWIGVGLLVLAVFILAGTKGG